MLMSTFNVPTLFLSGRRDELIPPLHMQQLYDLSQSDLKEIVMFEHGTHNDTCIQPGYFEAIKQFYQKVSKGRGRTLNE
jgi:abhydrolase domain-containing protein 13